MTPLSRLRTAGIGLTFAVVMAAPVTANATTERTELKSCFYTGENYSGGHVCLSQPAQEVYCHDFNNSLQGHRSGYNRFGHDIVLSEGLCDRPGRSFTLHVGENSGVFPYAVRSMSYCRIC